jgi:CheY-like chemotaxis protein
MMGSVSALRGRVILIVEDEPLIALDMAEQVAAHGAHAMVANTVEEALSALARVKFAVAIIDHRLGREDASEVIRRLEQLQTPFLIHSGYGWRSADLTGAEAPKVRRAPHVHKCAGYEALYRNATQYEGRSLARLRTLAYERPA